MTHVVTGFVPRPKFADLGWHAIIMILGETSHSKGNAMKKITVRKCRASLCATGSILALVLGGATYAQSSAIQVTINDKPVIFQGSQPQQINGSVMVPLRGVFEQLGASVQWNGMTRTIEAVRGTTDVILRVGQDTAYINNAAQPLDQAPTVFGSSTLVPLRFVAQAFGATVNWISETRTVAIRTVSAPLQASGPETKGGTVSGQIVALNPTGDQQIVISIEGRRVVVPVSTSTFIFLQRGKEPAVEVPLDRLLPGDFVQVTRPDANGPATMVRASYDEVTGKIKSLGRLMSGSHVLTVQVERKEDAILEISRAALITNHGTPVAWNDLHVGDDVAVRIDTTNQLGYAVNVTTATHVAVQPTPAPAPVVVDKQISVESIRVESTGPLKAGDMLKVTVRGTEGVRAAFSVSGIADAVPMTETTPGVYRGSYAVPANININGGAVVGRLVNKSGAQPVLIQAPQTVTIDSKAPTITNERPQSTGEVSTGVPRISATLDDGTGSGIDTSACKVALDGQDVTRDAIVEPTFLTYQPANVLTDGEHRVRVTVSDQVGNQATRDWTFVVNARKGLVTSLDSNIPQANNHISAGNTLRLELRAQPGGNATFSIGGITQSEPMKEQSPGVYVGQYVPRVGMTTRNAPIDVKFVSKSGAVVSTPLKTPINIDAGLPVKPTIVQPKPDDVVPAHVIISGTAAPNATVQIDVIYKSPALFGVAVNTGKAASTQVIADANGKWHTDDVALSAGGFLGTVKGTTYTVTAFVLDATGQQSDADSVTFRQQ